MTVADLRKSLENVPGELSVFFYDYEGMLHPGFAASGASVGVASIKDAQNYPDKLSVGSEYLFLE